MHWWMCRYTYLRQYNQEKNKGSFGDWFVRWLVCSCDRRIPIFDVFNHYYLIPIKEDSLTNAYREVRFVYVEECTSLSAKLFMVVSNWVKLKMHSETMYWRTLLSYRCKSISPIRLFVILSSLFTMYIIFVRYYFRIT